MSGDGGAGQVFFVSTVGSVAGVVVTAFAIIPNLTNFRALLWLAMVLCIIVALASLKAYALPLRHKIRLAAAAAIVAVVSGIFLFGQARYLDLLTKSDDPDFQLAILGERRHDTVRRWRRWSGLLRQHRWLGRRCGRDGVRHYSEPDEL